MERGRRVSFDSSERESKRPRAYLASALLKLLRLEMTTVLGHDLHDNGAEEGHNLLLLARGVRLATPPTRRPSCPLPRCILGRSPLLLDLGRFLGSDCLRLLLRLSNDGVDVDGGGSGLGSRDDGLDGRGGRRAPLDFSADGVLVVSLAGIVLVLTPADREGGGRWANDGRFGFDEDGASKSGVVDDRLFESSTLGCEVFNGELGGAFAIAVLASLLREDEGSAKATVGAREIVTHPDGPGYPVSELERVPVVQQLMEKSVSTSRANEKERAELTSVAIFDIRSSIISAQRCTLGSIFESSTLLRVLSVQLPRISRSCSIRTGEVSSAFCDERGEAPTHQSDDADVVGVLLEDMAHEVEAMQAEQSVANVLIGRHLRPEKRKYEPRRNSEGGEAHLNTMKQLFKNTASLNSLANSSGDLGHLVELDGLEVGLWRARRVSNDVEVTNARRTTHQKVLVKLLRLLLLSPP